MKNQNIFSDFAENLELTIPADTTFEEHISDVREWHRKRLGKFTASRIAKIMQGGRRKDELFGQGAMTEILKIAAERDLTQEGQVQYIDQLISNDFKQTRWGNDNEPIALDLIGAVKVRGRSHPHFPMFGASPDGELSDGTLVEVKCPWTIEKHKLYGRLTSAEDNEYFAQMQAQMAVFDAPEVMFVSYDPRSNTPLYFQTVARNDEYIADMLHRISEAEKIINQINSK